MEFQGIEVIDGNRQQQQKRYTSNRRPSQYILAIEIDHGDEPEINNVFELRAHPSMGGSHPSMPPREKVPAGLIIMAMNLANNTR